MAFNPLGLDAAIVTEWYMHAVAAIYDLQPAVFGRHLVHGGEDCQMLDILDVSIGIGVDMGIEASFGRISKVV